MNKLRVIIAGGRDFKDYVFLRTMMDKLLRNYSKDDVEIVSGCQVSRFGMARWGADYFGEKYAEEKGISVKKFPPDWDRYGKSAGPRRNRQMAEYATHCALFWNGQSKGSKNMKELSEEYKLKLKVFNY
jgi:hypothetical protein